MEEEERKIFALTEEGVGVLGTGSGEGAWPTDNGG